MLFFLLACSTPAPVPETPEPVETVGVRLASWDAERVSEAKSRLQSSPGGKLLDQAIEAHGGLAPWLAQGTITFDFDYAPESGEGRRYTQNRIDLAGRRAVQKELGDGADATLGWDGSKAWIEPSPEAFPSDPRFWATTPFYFVGLPWVLADPGTRIELLPPTSVPLTGTEEPLPTVKVGFEPGIGDAPDDYYVLHLDPTSHQIRAIRYIVTFGKKADDGPRPEKLMVWSAPTTVSGLVIPTRYESHAWNDGSPGERTTVTTISNVDFGETIPVSAFSAP